MEINKMREITEIQPPEGQKVFEDIEYLLTEKEHGPYISESLERVMEYSRDLNKYFSATEVWKIEDRAAQAGILLNCLNGLCNLSVLMMPFLPDTSVRLRKMLGLPVLKTEVGVNNWKDGASGSYASIEEFLLSSKLTSIQDILKTTEETLKEDSAIKMGK